MIGVATAGNGSNTCTINASNGLFVNSDVFNTGYFNGSYGIPSTGVMTFQPPTEFTNRIGFAYYFFVYCGGYLGGDAFYGIIYPRRGTGIIQWTLGNGGGTGWNGQATVTSVVSNVVTLSVPGYGGGMWGTVAYKAIL